MAEGAITDTGGNPPQSGTVKFSIERDGTRFHRPILLGVTAAIGYRFIGVVSFKIKFADGRNGTGLEAVQSFPFNLLKGWVEYSASVEITGWFSNEKGVIFSPYRGGQIIYDTVTGKPMCYTK